MKDELSLIKKRYGEKFSHLCRNLFPTILEEEGMLINILADHFDSTHFLYDDIINNSLVQCFKNYIYSIAKTNTLFKEKIVIEKPEVLMNSVGYVLKECKSEEEIQSYKKYYKDDERICTFNGGRLNSARVFFAVKKNVDSINRETFKKPKRQDEYGTSVISIQFTNDGTNTLSIKNRYNSKVKNPDATFSNNLDNIVAGLTESFEKTYGLIQKYKNNKFEIPNYVSASNGKFYRYNYKINNIYYCINNVIIDNFEVKKYDKEKYIILDYFILDLVNKRISLYDDNIDDSFTDTITNITNIDVINNGDNKLIILKNNGENIEILLNKYNQIIEYKNNNLNQIAENFMYQNYTMKEFESLNLEKIGYSFLLLNRCLEKINIPNVTQIDNCFLFNNKALKRICFSKLEKTGIGFLFHNKCIEEVECQNLKEIGDWFLQNASALKQINIPKLDSLNVNYLSEYVYNLIDKDKVKIKILTK